MGLKKLIQSIPDMIKSDIQERVSPYWKGDVISFEEVQYEVNGSMEDFVRIDIKNNNDKYFIEVREATGEVYLKGNDDVFKLRSGKEMIMSEVASYFRAEVDAEAVHFAESLFKKPVAVEEVVWECNLGLTEARIIRREDRKFELQSKEYDHNFVNEKGQYYKTNWKTSNTFKFFKQIGDNSNYAFLKITHSNGAVEYVNQYGSKLTRTQKRNLGIRSGYGI